MKTMEKHQLLKRALSLLVTIALAFVINAVITYAGKHFLTTPSTSSDRTVVVASICPIPPPPPPAQR